MMSRRTTRVLWLAVLVACTLTGTLCAAPSASLRAASRAESRDAEEQPSIFRGVVVANSDVGVRVVSVEAGTQAAMAGLQPEDLIVRINGDDVRSIDEFATRSTTGPTGFGGAAMGSPVAFSGTAETTGVAMAPDWRIRCSKRSAPSTQASAIRLTKRATDLMASSLPGIT